MKQSSRSIIVDADVARASADPSPSRHAVACARALAEIRSSEVLCVVFEQQLRQEWLENQGRFARKWLLSMYARRRVRTHASVLAWHALRAVIEALPPRARSTAEKDLHLVELARHDGWRLVSLDGKARHVFVTACRGCPELERVAWADPTTEEALHWLKGGAREHRFLLGDEQGRSSTERPRVSRRS